MTKPAMGIIITAALLTLIHCAKPNQPEEPSYFVKTPMPDELAELSALYLSGEILAPQELYDRVHRDLEVIRAEYGNGYIVIQENDFCDQISASCFTAYLDSLHFNSIEVGEYTAWDSLNMLYQFDDGSFYAYPPGKSVYMEFQGRKNPKVLIASYLQLPGFLNAHLCFPVYNGFGVRRMYAPRISSDTISYWFDDGEGGNLYFVSTPPNVLNFIG